VPAATAGDPLHPREAAVIGASQRPYGALLAYDRCVRAMLADPAVSGDLLLIGFVLVRAWHLDEPGEGSGQRTWSHVAELVFGDAEQVNRVIAALEADVPPYDPVARTWGTTRGGVLARHIPQFGWSRLWGRLHPDAPDGELLQPVRPQLTLVRNDWPDAEAEQGAAPC